MTPEQLNAYWTRTFPECPPVGYLLKHLYRTRCARFRNFDNGRQYPASESDFADVCRRQNALMRYVFGDHEDVVLITTIPSEFETPPAGTPPFLNFDPRGVFFQSLGMHEFELEFETPSYWHLFMSCWTLEPGRFDALLRASAEEPSASGVVNTLILGPARRRLLYVYPGGADAVLESAESRDDANNRFAEWSL